MRSLSRRSATWMAVLELTIAAGIVAFWAAFFSFDLVRSGDPRFNEIYLAFESAFPPADLFLTILLIFGGLGLLKDRPRGYFFTLMAGSVLLFLALLDISFNIRHGVYLLGAGEAILNLGINGLCLAAGSFFVFGILRSGCESPDREKGRRPTTAAGPSSVPASSSSKLGRFIDA